MASRVICERRVLFVLQHCLGIILSGQREPGIVSISQMENADRSCAGVFPGHTAAGYQAGIYDLRTTLR